MDSSTPTVKDVIGGEGERTEVQGTEKCLNRVLETTSRRVLTESDGEISNLDTTGPVTTDRCVPTTREFYTDHVDSLT